LCRPSVPALLMADDSPQSEMSAKRKKSKPPKREKKSAYFNSGATNFCSSSAPICMVSQDKWTPPRSPFNLIQENLFHRPWQLLVATIFLNRTGGARAIPLALEFLERYPTPAEALEAPLEDIAEILRPIGLNWRRARTIQRFTRERNCISVTAFLIFTLTRIWLPPPQSSPSACSTPRRPRRRRAALASC
jgi:hypothetical protein